MKDEWQENVGALRFHAKMICQGKDVNDHVTRAKLRLVEIEQFCRVADGNPKGKNKEMTIKEATRRILARIIPGNFDGCWLVREVKYVLNNFDVYADTILHHLRDLVKAGEFDIQFDDNFPKSYSKYIKY